MSKYPFAFDEKKTALIVVDMQNDFVRVGASMEVTDTRKTIPAIAKLIEFAYEKKMPVVFTKFVSGPNRTLLWNWSPQIPELKCCWRGYKRIYEDAEGLLDCTDIVKELYPREGDYIIEKYGYSAFINTPLIDILHAEDCDSVIIVGTVTQICVADTVHSAFHCGLKTIVASDGCSSFVPHLHDAALENMNMKYGVVATAQEIMEEFEKK